MGFFKSPVLADLKLSFVTGLETTIYKDALFVCLLGILNPDALRVDDENWTSLTIRRIFFRKHGVAEKNYTTIPGKQIAVNFHELETPKTIRNPVTSKK